MPLPPSTPSTERRLARQTQRGGNLERRSPGHWYEVGAPGNAPFINGVAAAPTALVPNPVPPRYRWTLGAGPEVEGDFAELSPGDIVFVFPVDFRPLYDKPVGGHDDDGNYVACRILTTGEFLYGVA